MAERREPALTVVTGPRGGRKRFYSTEDFRAWLYQEIELFNWVGGPPEQDYQSLKRYVDQNWHQLSTSESQDENVVRTLQNQIDTKYPRRLIASEDPRGKLVLELKAPNVDVGRGAYLAFSGNGNAAQALGAAEAALFLSGVKRSNETAADLLGDMMGEWRERHDELHEGSKAAFETQLEEQRDDYATLKAEVKALIESQKQNQTERTTGYDDLVQRVEGELAEVKERYEIFMRSRAPVEYWREKAEGHTKSAWGLAAASTLSALALGYFLVDLVQTIISQDTNPTGNLLDQAGYIEFFTLVTVATLGVWALRVVVRLLLSQAHLASDCRERAVMAESYYAMMQDETIDPQERHLALASLFRPSSTGMVKDDAAPPTMVELVTRKLSK